MQPTSFVVRQSTRDLTAMSGLAFVGIALHRFAQIAQHIDPKFPTRQGLPSSQILAGYIGLLAEGKSDFEAIEGKRGDRFFAQSLGLSGVPSAATLRQRMDALGVAGSESVDAFAAGAAAQAWPGAFLARDHRPCAARSGRILPGQFR
ncbi:hypothetical protein EO087_09550 [Dyella sp. M7H15-1]|uniref:hypothetical protein n=1 Tax=Dyella sp. M7H15-1 TaxID=2501295 RepID=UPI001004E4B6|nr:hypothetical protein [Dyella sp. M7H15-1]QAU24202.1 hypothetical protein EO087_09550 [Dyella sp. M7H15-1]